MPLDDAAASAPTSQPSGTPPGTPPPAGSSGSGTAGESAQMNVVTDVHADGDLSIRNYTYHLSQRQSAIRQFTFADGRVVTETEEKWSVEHFVGMEHDADGLVRHLEDRRVLILSAEPGARKVTAATHLALELRRRGACAEPPIIFDPVDRQVRLDIRHLPTKHTEFKDRVVIFRYPLSRGNAYLADAFGKIDRSGWVQLADCLRQRNAFMVFTTTPAETEQFAAPHALHRVHRVLAPHSEEVLARRFKRYLGTLQQRGEAAAESARVLLKEEKQLLRHFPFAPQLLDFVDFFLGLDQASPTLDDALARFRDTSKRLLHDVQDDDLEGWAFGFCLALAQAAPDASGVPWVDFDRLRRHMHRWLRRDLRPAGGTLDDVESAEPSEVRLELSDDSLLSRSRARVEKDPATLADVIRFSDGRPAGGLWRILLTRHRRVLTAIIPRLRELAERPDHDGRTMSVLAAQIIGRIGEIDCDRIVAPMMERWATLDGGRHHGLVGAMFEGLLGSDDAKFRARGLQHLRSLHASDSTATDRRRVEAAIAAYSWIGYYDFPLAMEQLYRIVRATLVPMLDDANRISRLVERIQRDREEQRAADDVTARAVQEVLRSLAERIYAERRGIFLGVQFTLVSLCVTHGAVKVLRELSEWIGRGGASMGVLVALMFLHEQGIANQLADDRIEFPGAQDGPPFTCGHFVAALAGGDDDVRQAVAFLVDLHESVTLPGATEPLVQQHFREQLQAHLLIWVKEALEIPELVSPMRRMIEQLASTHHTKLRQLVDQLVAGREFKSSPSLRKFSATLRL